MTGLAKLCDAHTYGPDADKRAAGDALSRNLEIYGASISAQEYNAETATITNILADWNTKPDLIAAAALIGATEWTTALETVNTGFRKMYLQRNAEQAAGYTPDTLRNKRAETNQAWYKLRDRINSFMVINDGAAPWSIATPQLNALIDKYNDTLAVRAGRASDSHGGNAAEGGDDQADPEYHISAPPVR